MDGVGAIRVVPLDIVVLKLSPTHLEIIIQWNLYITDTIRTLPNYPHYRGVLSLEVGSKYA